MFVAAIQANKKWMYVHKIHRLEVGYVVFDGALCDFLVNFSQFILNIYAIRKIIVKIWRTLKEIVMLTMRLVDAQLQVWYWAKVLYAIFLVTELTNWRFYD